ncbi:uroporphyrinogen-III synthase [uncultured Micrococcus sp.]|uniref:uroporphyrinogen-III synthase n=1 Tax=uncultured Micrococcus sp. TaxID=114051 RepID=UPI00259466FB|nr:uroporphyrinogen-III synthase [uncultured Micrococcus sp.]
MRVLLTRQPAQASRLEAGLAGARVPGTVGRDGAGEPVDVALLPLTDFALPDDDAPLRALVRELAGQPRSTEPVQEQASEPSAAPRATGRWLIVTSPNTVRALARVGWDGLLPADVRVAATGPGTARALREAGCAAPVWTPHRDRSARGIAAGLRELVPGGARAWLPQSDRARPALTDALRGAGWAVQTVLAYRTVAYPARESRRVLAAAAGNEVDGTVATGPKAGMTLPTWSPGELAAAEAGTVVVLTSSSAAEQFAERCRPRGGGAAEALLIAIGDPTAETMRALALPVAAVCATPDAAGVLEALAGLRRQG